MPNVIVCPGEHILTAFDRGELPEEMAAEVRAHLAHCPRCGRFDPEDPAEAAAPSDWVDPVAAVPDRPRASVAEDTPYPLAALQLILDPETDPNNCPRCGHELRKLATKSWCFHCGYDPVEAAKAAAARARPKKGWGLGVLVFAALGCLTIVAATALRRELAPDRTYARMWWVAFEAGAGLLLLLAGHVAAVVLTARYWSSTDGFPLFDPVAVLRYGFGYLPRTRWAVAVAAWGATAFVAALMLFFLYNFAVKDPTAKPPIGAPASHGRPAGPGEHGDPAPGGPGSPGEAGRGDRREAREVDEIDPDAGPAPKLRLATQSGTAVVIGYVPDPNDPDKVSQLVLGTRGPDGKLHYAGTTSQFAQDDEGLARLKGLKRLPKAPDYLPGKNVVAVEPTLTATVNYAEQDKQGRLKDVVVRSVRDAEKADGGK